MVLQIVSFIVISHLLQKNAELEQTIRRNSISDAHKLTRTKKLTTTDITTHYSFKKTLQQKENRNDLIDIPSNPEKEFSTKKTPPPSHTNPNKTNSNKDLIITTSSTIKKEPRKFTPSLLTIIVFKSSFNDPEAKTLANIRRLYPTAHILDINNTKEINTIISRITTEYFLILEKSMMLSNRKTESIDLLWDVLERYSEIDFVGGSYLSGDKLRVVCHRHRLCRWTFSVSYEYERSLGNVMICDETSSSFMGRRASLDKIKGFDPNISSNLIVQEFFLRAKLSKNIVVGTVPNVMFLLNNFSTWCELSQSKDITKDLLSFATKHKVFIFKDSEGNTIDLCSSSSPLSGKNVCEEEIAHKVMLDGGHWAYQGIFAYPYILNYLNTTLTQLIKFFEEHNIKYIVFGGVALGAIKTRSILPWEAGDIDIDVYGMNQEQLYNLMEPWAEKNGFILRKYEKEAVHIFCTPRNVGQVSGGLATIFPQPFEQPPDYVKIKTNDVWVRYVRQFDKQFLEHYGDKYLQHKLYRSEETTECKIKDHNACLPNFKSLYQGKAGTLKDFYCRS